MRKQKIIEDINEILNKMSFVELEAVYRAICKLKGIKK